MPGVLILAGPTASGKTALAIELARTFGAEIVGADSRQIYRGMPVGTAAPSAVEQATVPHHLIGFLDPHERYSAAQFTIDAVDAIRSIHARGRRAIVVGGTGFYVRALTGDVALAAAYDAQVRERLAREARVHDAPFLHQWLAHFDPQRARALDPNDAYRILRALEIVFARPATSQARTGGQTLRTLGLPFLKVFLDVPVAENDRRIDERAEAMLAEGLVEEAERVGEDAVAASAVGYPEALAFLRGWSTREELRTSLARATRRYARRQRSWFRREPDTRWLAPDAVAGAARELLGWS